MRRSRAIASALLAGALTAALGLPDGVTSADASFRGTTANAGNSFASTANFSAGSLYMWGGESDGQRTLDTTVPQRIGTGTTWSVIDGGHDEACGIKTDGTLWCWGQGYDGELGLNENRDHGAPVQVGTATNWATVSASYATTCAIKTTGTLWCWGYNTYGDLGLGDTTDRWLPTQVGVLTTWSKVSTVAGDSTCAIKTDGTLWCWGRNSNGEVGDNSIIERDSPVQIGVATTWSTISAGLDSFFCGTQTDHSIWCWGKNNVGQLGQNNTTELHVPTQVSNALPTVIGTTWATVTTGYEVVCATMTSGALACWGRNDYGQVGDNTQTDRWAPTQVGALTTWSSVVAYESGNCAIKTTGTLWCWGYNAHGEAGLGNITNPQKTPVQVGTDTDWAMAGGGNQQNWAIKTGGTLWGWGNDTNPAIGLDAYSPVQVGAVTTWTNPIMGAYHDCAARTDGTMWCWGYGGDGQLGQGDTTSYSTVKQVGVATDWSIAVGADAAGSRFNCGVRTTGKLYCWGKNSDGQLGVGSTTQKNSATQESTLATDWATVAAGDVHACGVRTTGRLYCWGKNTWGNLGIAVADVTRRTSPTQVSGALTTWSQVSVGWEHSCAIKTDGTLWCWGSNDEGALGDGTTTQREVPTQVGVGTTWATISAGAYQTCATKTDGTLWCWGYNSNGEVGDGSTTNRSSPTQVGVSTSWKTVNAYNNFTCGTQTGRTVWCWGRGNRGQLGNGAVTDSTTPVQIPGFQARPLGVGPYSGNKTVFAIV